MEECVAKNVNFWTHALQWMNVKPKMVILGPMHYNVRVCSQLINFLDICITVEEYVAKNVNFWIHAIQWRNV